jgi:hypothetical protein
MPAPLEHVVRPVLNPYAKRIRHAIDQGIKSMIRRNGKTNLYRRTDSAVHFDCIMQAMFAEFAKDRESVKIFKLKTTAYFLFDGKVVVRVKKASRSAKGRNIPTAANNRFLSQMLPFKDAPAAMKVEICWKLNAPGTASDAIFVTARKGNGIDWKYELPGGAQQTLDFPAATPAEAPVRRRVVKLKEGGTRKKSVGDAS